MDEKIREKLITHLTDDRSVEYYVALAGKKATKTDCRALANAMIPYMLDQLDSKAGKATKTADKLREYILQAGEKGVAEDPKFGSTVLSALLGSKKMEMIGFHADDMLVHPFVIENMLIAMAPMVLRVYGNEFRKELFPPMPGPMGMPGPGRPGEPRGRR